VVVREASVRHEVIPAEYAVRSRKVMISPPQVAHDVIPAQYATHHRQVVVRPATRGWQPIGNGY
jgi:hypothetical protein